MRGRSLLVVATALVWSACSGDTAVSSPSTAATETSTARPTTTTVVVTTTAPPTTTAAVPPTTLPDPEDTLSLFLQAVEAADEPALTALLAPGASWSEDDARLVVAEPIPDDLGWLINVLGLPDDATTTDLILAGVQARAAIGTRYEVSDCRSSERTVVCSVARSNPTSEIIGGSSSGRLTLEFADGGAISGVTFETLEESMPATDADAFRRWTAVEDPEAARFGLFGPAAALADLAEDWLALGRPDLPTPDPAHDPIAVVAAYLDARNSRDWAAHMALLGGDALDNPFGSKEEFDAAEYLERVITLVACTTALENSAQGTFVACEVAVDDIIVQAAGEAPTNPNDTTFRVKDGRVVDLPEFLPSLFRAEQAIEAWAEANEPSAYEATCPDGIAGQSVLDGRDCARFIADHRSEWGPVVAASR